MTKPRIPATTMVLGLLCLMYGITYIDRVNVSTAAPVFGKELHLSNTEIGLVFSAFAYHWIPQFFLNSYQLNLRNSALFAAGVFFGGVVGDTLGGVVSDRVFHRTGSRNLARRNLVVVGFLASLAFMVPILFFHNVTVAAICLSLAFFFSEFTVGPMWAIPMDIAPEYAGSASGLMNTGSALAAIVSPLIAGHVIDKTGNWTLPFVGSIGLLLIGSLSAFLMKPAEGLDFPISPEPKVAAQSAV
jgi:MFS family permease